MCLGLLSFEGVGGHLTLEILQMLYNSIVPDQLQSLYLFPTRLLYFHEAMKWLLTDRPRAQGEH